MQIRLSFDVTTFRMVLCRCVMLAAATWLNLAPAAAQETLYNGIQLPAEWPPRPDSFVHDQPVPPPYLTSPPRVIPIDVGRQLFVDDFLIAATTMKRTYHQPEYHANNPILSATTPHDRWRDKPFAAPFSDGVWWDPAERTFKMWYLTGTGYGFGYATSHDGITWKKPELAAGRHGNTNVLDIQPASRDSSTVWLDLEAENPNRRFVMVYYRSGLQTRFSRDGLVWSDIVATHKSGDRTTLFYNPFRKVWVYSVRGSARGVGRCRLYGETRDLSAKCWENVSELAKWAAADELDKVRQIQFDGELPDLYNLDATPYESLLLGLFTIHSQVADPQSGRPKLNAVTLGYSRDGFHWHRPDRRPFLDVSEDSDAWNWGNVQSAGGGCLIVGDKLYFYFSGRNSRRQPDDGSGGATGLATLRRDGFASMDAGESAATLLTRPLEFRGKHLFVNVDAGGGALRAEVLDARGKPVEPFTLANCETIERDGATIPVTWKGAENLSAVAGQAVQIRFELTSGKLYSFWVAPDASGASHGYVAAGGPGFTSNRDTVGRAR